MKIRLGSLKIGLFAYMALWTAVALLFALQNKLNHGMPATNWPLWDMLRWSLIQWYTWAALAPTVFRLAERYPVRDTLIFHGLGRQLLISLCVTFIAMMIGAMVSTLFEPSGFDEQLRYFLQQHYAIGLLTYWMLFAIQQAVHFHAEKARRELEASQLATDLAQSRLLVLRSQLQPHFLFNTLHAIITLLEEDSASAEDMLLRLSELLRAFLEDYDGQEISLRQELVLLELYLGIQRTRFKDRLTTRIYIAPDTLDCAVPSLILQPIVENAIHHGIGKRVGADSIEIESRREGDMLYLDVRNRNSDIDNQGASTRADPLACDTRQAPSHGIGLSNTRLRLKELYGDAARVRLDITWPQGVVCRIQLPFRAFEEPTAETFGRDSRGVAANRRDAGLFNEEDDPEVPRA
ncbi:MULTISPECIES: histidine kinase [Pseudoxanthomonas]|uniref:Two-component system LytT family sensor kinase n=1 Tax=Pseudoxanthomonas winnipegensis TaxID=2480810 RepID=A0AAW8GAG9_9GAMM|nr:MULTISPECIES: histidine kinase [Pseudoxanthomonas]MDQ1118932.1 two-component system LytT family sensor kinase [Pseudoxanthomonas winnipegensis]MDQ1132120.1 two-component system LytT family sensor kinase [Pseudoxanthomonas winnipegensis]MDR6137867.1 two-component system LytT family sensor kinase [Pseudoxanthomonas sp. SORGH_AS_0997]